MFALDHHRRQDVQVQIAGMKVGDGGRCIGKHMGHNLGGWVEVMIGARHGDQFAVRLGPGFDDAKIAQLGLTGQHVNPPGFVNAELDQFVARAAHGWKFGQGIDVLGQWHRRALLIGLQRAAGLFGADDGRWLG